MSAPKASDSCHYAATQWESLSGCVMAHRDRQQHCRVGRGGNSTFVGELHPLSHVQLHIRVFLDQAALEQCLNNQFFGLSAEQVGIYASDSRRAVNGGRSGLKVSAAVKAGTARQRSEDVRVKM